MWLEIHWRVDAVICERHNATASIDAERLHMFTFTCTAKSQEHSNTHSQRICNSHTHTHNTHDPRHIYSVSVLISWVEETSFSRIKNVFCSVFFSRLCFAYKFHNAINLNMLCILYMYMQYDMWLLAVRAIGTSVRFSHRFDEATSNNQPNIQMANTSMMHCNQLSDIYVFCVVYTL